MEKILLHYINQQVTGHSVHENIEAEEDLLGGGILDSMGMMKFILFIEKEFDIKVPPEDMIIENFMSIATIVDYIEKNK